MSDLPIDSNNQPPSPGATPGHTGSTPPAPSGHRGGAYSEKAPSGEVVPSPEIRKSPETLAVPEKLSVPKPETSKKEGGPEEPETAIEETSPPPNIVDKTEQINQLHEIKKPMDKLTKEADDEEEHFIEEVEKHHGHS